mmetsp:Transcript_6909/g.19188  ORF Transcript_6909/g.19188 Transcript_6909/m.19188 type:complete len:237 (+) Transcript_6909:197-907(+)
MGLCQQSPSVLPLQPQRHLAGERPGAEPCRHALLTPVVVQQLAIGQEVHSICLLAIDQHVVPDVREDFCGGEVADVHEACRRCNVQHFQEGVAHQDGCEDLRVQVKLERFGHGCESLDVHQTQVPLPGLVVFPQESIDQPPKPEGDPVLQDELPHLCLLLQALLVDPPEMRHRIGDGAHEGGEAYQGAHDHANGEGSLIGVFRHDLHRSRRELRKAPVQGRYVDVLERKFLVARRL